MSHSQDPIYLRYFIFAILMILCVFRLLPTLVGQKSHYFSSQPTSRLPATFGQYKIFYQCILQLNVFKIVSPDLPTVSTPFQRL